MKGVTLMKLLKFFIAVLLIIFLSACNSETESNKLSNSSQTSTNSNNTVTLNHQYLTNNVILNSDFNTKDWLTVNLPEIGLKNVTIGSVVNGNVVKRDTASITSLPVYILCDYKRYNDGVLHDSYLAVVTDSKILLKDLTVGNDGGSSYNDTLYVCDVDSDGIDEIVLQQTVGMSGGAGQFWSRVFKVVEDGICEIFNSTIVDATNNDWSVFDTGFTGEFLSGKRLKICNAITGYNKILDISNRYNEEFFDENGKAKQSIGIWCDSFFEFYPEDVDGDGVFEIICMQYVSLASHADYIGDAKSILKFNSNKQTFEVIEAEFVSVH